MSRLPNGATGRTEYNSTPGRIVWEINADMNLDEVASVPFTGEVERTGKTVNERRIYHVIARTEGMARALFLEQHKYTRIIGELTIKPICSIDGEIEFGHG